MTVYLFPPPLDPADVVDVAKKAGAPFNQYSTLRELILNEKGGPIVLATIRPQDLLVLNRHAATLVEELPTVVMSAPGFIYSPDWVSTASALPAMDWKELAGKLSKSGHLALTPESLERRDLGSAVFEAPEGLGSSVLNRKVKPVGEPENDSFDPESDLNP